MFVLLESESRGGVPEVALVLESIFLPGFFPSNSIQPPPSQKSTNPPPNPPLHAIVSKWGAIPIRIVCVLLPQMS